MRRKRGKKGLEEAPVLPEEGEEEEETVEQRQKALVKALREERKLRKAQGIRISAKVPRISRL